MQIPVIVIRSEPGAPAAPAYTALLAAAPSQEARSLRVLKDQNAELLF